ncbi:Spo11/DNA topoisomerase VI subunit A [Peziza echinospora]|nr:Spo11/DNA topoisomerase VI subunit A [Peziza echinospora]
MEERLPPIQHLYRPLPPRTPPSTDLSEPFEILMPISEIQHLGQWAESVLPLKSSAQLDADLLSWFDEAEPSKLVKHTMDEPAENTMDDFDLGVLFHDNAQRHLRVIGNWPQSMQSTPNQSQQTFSEDALLLLSDSADHTAPPETKIACTMRTSSTQAEQNFETTHVQPLLDFEFPEQGSDKSREYVIQCIETIFSNIADVLSGASEQSQLELRVKVRSSRAKDAQRFDPITKSIRNGAQYTLRLLQFPGRTAGETWKFTVLLRVLDLIYEALVGDRITTKRDIYYKDVALFKRQSVVDAIVDDIAYTLGVRRSGLNVVSAAKGLVCGQLHIWNEGGHLTDCSKHREGILIPNIRSIERLDLLDTKWILVIEKEATFRSLAAEKFWDHSSAGKGILITGKGYPDISTREFLRLLSLSSSASKQATIRAPNVSPDSSFQCSMSEESNVHRYNGLPKIYALVDYDPHGLNILSVYKNGSISLAHENHRLVVSGIGYLGLKSKDLFTSQTQTSYTGFDDGNLRLTERDRRKAVSMLGKECIWGEIEWRRELQRMLFFNMKAEIQAMDMGKNGDGEGFITYLEQKLIEAESQSG